MILNILRSAWQVNVEYVIVLDIVIALLYIFNILLGTIIGTSQEGFSIKKFLFGVLKTVGVLIIVIGVCYTLNIFALVINLIEGLEISTSIVNALEVIGIIVAIGIDMAKEVIDKIKDFRELKYISYDDVRTIDYNVADRG